MTKNEKPSELPPEYEVLYEKLRTADAEATVKADKIIRREMTVADQVAESLADAPSWPPFTTYLCG